MKPLPEVPNPHSPAVQKAMARFWARLKQIAALERTDMAADERTTLLNQQTAAIQTKKETV
jgi:hypothetical protein